MSVGKSGAKQSVISHPLSFPVLHTGFNKWKLVQWLTEVSNRTASVQSVFLLLSSTFWLWWSIGVKHRTHPDSGKLPEREFFRTKLMNFSMAEMFRHFCLFRPKAIFLPKLFLAQRRTFSPYTGLSKRTGARLRESARIAHAVARRPLWHEIYVVLVEQGTNSFAQPCSLGWN